MSRLGIVGTILFLSLSAQASEIKIVAHASIQVSELSAEELKQVFLLKTNSLRGGAYVQPVVSLGEPTYGLFLKEYLGKTDSALRTYYRSLVFTGRALMPKILDSDAEVVAYVARTKGAIGYVGATAATSGLKSVSIKK